MILMSRFFLMIQKGFFYSKELVKFFCILAIYGFSSDFKITDDERGT